MITDEIFVGPEVEGPDRGEETIFIPMGSFRKQQIDSIISYAEEHDIKRFYFGAGNQRGLAVNDVLLIEKLPVDFDILVEITEDDFEFIKQLNWHVSARLQLIFVIENECGVLFEHLKIVDKNYVYWKDLKNLSKWIDNPLDDKLYNQDKKIEL